MDNGAILTKKVRSRYVTLATVNSNMVCYVTQDNTWICMVGQCELDKETMRVKL